MLWNRRFAVDNTQGRFIISSTGFWRRCLEHITERGTYLIIADTVNKQVYEIIRNKILERQFKPGERIDPKIIAQEHNISLMPVRNALQQLTAQGLVVTLQRVGFFVKEFSGEELVEIIDTRKMFELYCLDAYFRNLDTGESLRLLDALRNTPDNHVKTLQALDDRMHQMIVQASRNAFLIGRYEDLRCLFNMGIYYAEQNVLIARDEHIDIVKSIRDGDKEKAILHLRHHLERVARELSQ